MSNDWDKGYQNADGPFRNIAPSSTLEMLGQMARDSELQRQRAAADAQSASSSTSTSSGSGTGALRLVLVVLALVVVGAIVTPIVTWTAQQMEQARLSAHAEELAEFLPEQIGAARRDGVMLSSAATAGAQAQYRNEQGAVFEVNVRHTTLIDPSRGFKDLQSSRNGSVRRTHETFQGLPALLTTYGDDRTVYSLLVDHVWIDASTPGVSRAAERQVRGAVAALPLSDIAAWAQAKNQ